MGESFKVGTPQIVFLLFLTKSCGLLLALLVQTNQDGPPAPPKKNMWSSAHPPSRCFRTCREMVLEQGCASSVRGATCAQELRERRQRTPGPFVGSKWAVFVGFLVSWCVGLSVSFLLTIKTNLPTLKQPCDQALTPA